MTILVIEDNPADVAMIRELLSDYTESFFDIVCADRLAAARPIFARGGIDIILLDLGLPDSQGLGTLREVRDHAGGVPIVVLTLLDNEETGLAALKEGAQDYLVKGQMNGPSIVRSLRYAMERDRSEKELKKHRGHLEELVAERTIQLAAVNEELREQYSALAEKDGAIQELNRDLGRRVKERTARLNKTNRELKSAQKELHVQFDELARGGTLLALSEERFHRAFDDAAIGMAIVAPDGKLLKVNHEFNRILGYSGEEILEKTFREITFPADRAETNEPVESPSPGTQDIIRVERRYLHKDGRVVWVFINSILLKAADGTNLHFITQVQDITDRKRMREQIESSLAEKETMLREIHHRVKNNLQLVVSLLSLQTRKISDPATLGVLKDCENRVLAMSLVHEKLYRSESLSHIDFADYIRFLATQLNTFYSTDTQGVRLDFEMDEIMVDIHTAIPLGLIMNELISNALKHAFPCGKSGTIKISGDEQSDFITLVVRDNGVGLPDEFDWKNTVSLGMRLITNLVRQVHGTIEKGTGKGTKFVITIPGQLP